MAWIDNRIWAHPKLIGLSDRAWRIYVSAIAYSSGFLTEGRLSPVQQRAIGVTPRVKKELIQAGLWHEIGREIGIHDWEEHNAKRESKRLTEREQARERKRRQRQREAEMREQLSLDVTRDTDRDVTRDTAVTKGVTDLARARASAPPVTDDGMTVEEENQVAVDAARANGTLPVDEQQTTEDNEQDEPRITLPPLNRVFKDIP